MIKKTLRTLIISMAFVLTLSSCGGTSLIDSKASSKQTFDQSLLEEFYRDKVVTFNENGTTFEMKLSELGVSYELTEETKQLIENNEITTLENEHKIIKIEKNLDSELNKLNANRKENVEPFIYKSEDRLVVNNGEQGNLLNIEPLRTDITNEINNNADFEIDLTKYYYKLDTSKIAEYQEEIDKYNSFLIEYTNGEKFGISDILDYIEVVDNKVYYDSTNEGLMSKVREFALKTSKMYDTYYNEWDFTTTNGEQIKVKTDEKIYDDDTYGSISNSKEEIAVIQDKVARLESESNRKPVMKLENGDVIPNTYIEVSIADQHVWYYIDGKLEMDAGCVSGLKGKMDTPIGVFQVKSKAHDIYLLHNSFVHNWLGFTLSGHGLHDAMWRRNKEFENSDIYKKNGSHGCVNLPLDFATELYDKVPIGTVVVVYDTSI